MGLLILLLLGAVAGALAWLAAYNTGWGRKIITGRSAADADAEAARRSRMVRLKGDGTFEFPVVGEGHYQEALLAICGGHREGGHDHQTSAILVPEPDNPYNPKAVMVVIDGKKVGHISRDILEAYRSAMGRLGFDGLVAQCGATIVGGWERRRTGAVAGEVDRGQFGVRLDVAWPLSAHLVTVPTMAALNLGGEPAASASPEREPVLA
jgi:hypothetical protein